MEDSIRRNRIGYFLSLLLVIVIGGASRLSFTEEWPFLYTEYAGDTFWSLMIFLGIGFLFPTWKTSTVALLTLTFAYSIELSQLIQSPWITTLRETIFGKLVLGSGFLWSDFVCYTVGCLIGVIGEVFTRFVLRR
ncbi:DUF2809 domain-containing protein [Kiritimatiellota bacterium B12222]|nr:DUF2809 domain-containing protein [Kiritimatiellota bacterium B12222]